MNKMNVRKCADGYRLTLTKKQLSALRAMASVQSETIRGAQEGFRKYAHVTVPRDGNLDGAVSLLDDVWQSTHECFNDNGSVK